MTYQYRGLIKSQTRSRMSIRWGIAVSVTAAVLAASGCSATTRSAATGPEAPIRVSDQHVHGLIRDSGNNSIYVATHAGLLRLDQGKIERVGPVIDLMGFTAAGPGHFLASGHPGPGTDLPQPVGLIESTDGGVTWKVLSRGGESDFHALSASPRGVVAFDDVLRSTTDKRTWASHELPSPPATLSSSSDGSRVFATTEKGLMRSADQGATWSRIDTPALLQLVALAGRENVVGVTVDGRVVVSRNGGTSWAIAGGPGPSATVEALTASVLDDGKLEILAATGEGVQQSLDEGKTFKTVSS